MKPDADEAMRIAAIVHDIERATRTAEYDEASKKSEKGFMDERYLEHHQSKGAEIMGKFLEEEGAGGKVVEQVKAMISKHEVGGTEEQNLIKDADSLSYFEVNAERFAKKHMPLVGKEKVRQKFDWMFNRVSSAKAKELARPMYEKAIKMLESNVQS